MHAAEHERPDVRRQWEDWFEGQPDLDPARLIFIDESDASTKMACLRGRAKKGERPRCGATRSLENHDLHRRAEDRRARRPVLLDGVMWLLDGAMWLLDGAMDGEAFRTYRVLVPELTPGDVVVMDMKSAISAF